MNRVVLKQCKEKEKELWAIDKLHLVWILPFTWLTQIQYHQDL